MHCKRRHHSLIYLSNETRGSSTAPIVKSFNNYNLQDKNKEQSNIATETNVQKTALLQFTRGQTTMLPTAKIIVRSSNGQEMIVRALLDQGSEVSFISNRIVQLLHMRKFPDSTRIETIDNVYIGTAKARVDMTISPILNLKRIILISALVKSKRIRSTKSHINSSMETFTGT